MWWRPFRAFSAFRWISYLRNPPRIPVERPLAISDRARGGCVPRAETRHAVGLAQSAARPRIRPARWRACHSIQALRDRSLSGGALEKSSQPKTFFESMIAASVVGRAGAETVRPGGDWSAIPVVASTGEMGWVDPNGGTISENVMTFASRSRRPHMGTFSVDASRAKRRPSPRSGPISQRRAKFPIRMRSR